MYVCVCVCVSISFGLKLLKEKRMLRCLWRRHKFLRDGNGRSKICTTPSCKVNKCERVRERERVFVRMFRPGIPSSIFLVVLFGMLFWFLSLYFLFVVVFIFL